MNKILKQAIPPFVISAVKKRRSARAPFFRSFREALDSCGANGYQASDVVKVVVEKNLIYRNTMWSSRVIGLESLRTMIGVGAVNSPATLKVLDFGGGGGYHYSIARAVLSKERDIRWNVVETEATAAAAEAKLAGGGLKFFTDIHKAAADLGEIDLAFTSSALPYTPDPLAFLAKLISVRARHLFITRTALNDGDDAVISVQSSMLSENGPGPLPAGFQDREIRYPVTFASKRKAEQLICEAYDIRFRVDEDKNAHSVQGNPFHLYGYFCDLKKKQ
jgi:putative methyltransferase (TIGR04325 family)